ncbi:uncharacterized protein FIBRA_03410 [Fibroporia radiculosa]|uniref:Afadin and alpha-actinin-binding-domain-containing protein n=1 Tax=Fibroporia radiculosa TaxID=599839 RepID=J4GNG7_9APHY|nr:uncharacterized protein FIBRA_03410 [Fibroporia radiculosa]CCM01360.1 predicted protein [Fibroporia radiculosa]
MAATPKKLVHWALDVSFSGFGSPFSDTTSTESNSTSSLQYINSQLIAHGFTHSPGLSLEGLSKDDSDRIIKCLLGMLSQRVDDMSRTEELSTKIRTLSYDHERMVSMHKAATDRAANAEREMNVHKSRLAAVTRTLQSTETAHKHTTSELQRSRTTLQALRNAHQTELKKLEKEKDRMVERWSKIADAQIRLGSTSSALRCANADVLDAPDVEMRGKGQGFLDLALEQAEQARKDLFDQNRKLRGLILSTANEIQSVLHMVRNVTTPLPVHESYEEPAPLTLAMLFPLSPAQATCDKVPSLLSSLRESVARLSNPSAEPGPSTSTDNKTQKKANDKAELERLQAIIDTLRTELDEAQKQASAYASQTQALFDRFAADERLLQGEAGEVSVDLMTGPACDEEKQRLDARFKQLEEERQKFTEAAVRLGREKAVLEAERIKFLEEKRSWQVEAMLAELPPTPVQPSAAPLTQPLCDQDDLIQISSRKSPRKSPHKARAVGKASNGKKVRIPRRSSGLGLGLPSSSPKKVIPPFETEVIPSPSFPLPAFRTSIIQPQPQPHVAAPVFVLPPPSPAASFPQQSRLSSSLIPPLPAAFEIPPTDTTPSTLSVPVVPVISISKSDSDLSTVQHQASESVRASQSAPEVASGPSSGSQSLQVPCTPRRPFPMAKPFATHMIHAYSPVKPSPLSRILMLADSPESSDSGRPSLDSVKEDDEDESPNISPTPAPLDFASAAPGKSLAQELGVSDDDESPLREKKVEPNAVKISKPVAGARLPAKDKGKAKAVPTAVPRTRPAVPMEKENVKRAKLSTGAAAALAPTSQAAERLEKKSVKAPPKPFTRSRVPGKLPPGKGGARRVPIDSVEAAPVGPAWKG